MSISRKALKVLSVLFIVGGALEIALGAWGIAAGKAITGSAVDANVFGAAMITLGVIDILMGAAGIRAAGNPVRTKGALVWSIICLASGIVNIALTLPALGGVGVGPDAVVSLAVGVAFLCLVLSVRHEGRTHLE